MFVKDKAKVSGRVEGIKLRVVYFGKLVFESDKQEFSVGGKILAIASCRSMHIETANS